MATNGIPQLKQIIDDLVTELQQYAQKENANPFYIDRQNKLVQRLVAVYNETEELEHFYFWRAVATEMKRINNTNPQISGHTIQIRTRPTGEQFSLICINSFDR
jgi:hypothetical protein